MATDNEKIQTTIDQPATEVFEIDNAKEDLKEIQGIQLDKNEEKKLLRKMDFRITGYISVLYLMSYLDRGNIGNANTAGMSKDLHISDKQYQMLLTFFYISYILFEVLVVCWKIFPARYYVPVVVISWGIISTCSAAISGFAGMAVLRFLMGVFEAGYGPGVPYYLSRFYKRKELAWRVGIFMSMAPIASAFSGALAYGITSNKHLDIEGWRILFIVEGIPTVLLGIGAYWAIPSGPTDCRFLNEKEQEMLMIRSMKQNGDVDISHKLKLRDIVDSFLDIKNIICALMFFSINVSFSALPVFLPSIIKGMGYTAVRAQGFSSPPYVLTFFVVLFTAYLSDKYVQRGLAICIHSSIGAVGYLLLAVSSSVAVRYFAVYLTLVGIFPCIAVLLTWMSNLHASDGKKNVGYVILQFGGQCGPVLGTRLFPAKQGPLYREGMWIGFGFTCFLCTLSLILRTYLTILNKRLDKKQGFTVNLRELDDVPTDTDPNYRYVT